MNHVFTWRFDYEMHHFAYYFHILKPLGRLAFSWCFAHLRAAFTMGEEVGVTFPSSWGA